MMRRLATLVLVLLASTVSAQTDDPAQLLRSIYRELVEIDTTDSNGDTTVAAKAMAARLLAEGFPAEDVRVVVPAGAPRKGNLVARLRGTGAKRPLLLLAHIDVVEAAREAWQREPFKLIEEGGYFYARGASDDKAMAAIFVANLIRMRAEGVKPARDLILALTADEEIIPSPWNGVAYLLAQHRDLIDAELALNEGGGGTIDRSGRYHHHSVQAGEKVFQTFRLEVMNPGGHAARPMPDNAIYRLAAGLTRLAAFKFPARLNPVTRAYLQSMARIESGRTAADMAAAAASPPDEQALERLTASPGLNAILRTTCVATMLDAGHATNALPMRARAVINCRVLPDESVDAVAATLARVLADEGITVKPDGKPVPSPAPPLRPDLMGAIEAISAEMWPGVPIVPTMIAGATDGRFLNNAGIPTYGVSGIFRDVDGGGVHGVNERLPAKSLFEGQRFLDRLVRTLAAP